MATLRLPPRFLLILALALGPAARPQAPAASKLAARIQAHLDEPRFQAAQWGVHAVSLDTGRTVFACNAGKFGVPASTAKLFTCALALCRLGPDRRIRTSVFAPRRPGPDGVLKGDLVFYGRGDPMLMARWRGGPALPDPLEALARQVRDAGVQVLDGDVVGDDSCFANRPAGSGWEVQDRDYAYGADVSALTIHDNMVELRIYPGPAAGAPCFLFPIPGQGLLALRNLTRTGPGGPLRADWTATGLEVTGSLPQGAVPAMLPVPVREPARFAAGLLRRALERQGILVRGGVRAVHAPGPVPAAGAPVELAHVDSLPLRELVKATLKDSVNLYAQLLLLQDGGSEAAGLGDLGAFLREAGVQDGGVLLEEGSGLSRKDLVKPEALTSLLRYLRTRPEGAAFAEALPLAGVDGTLRHRLGDTRAAVNLRAKTGTLRYTHALAGYVTTAGGDHLAFAILLNNYLPGPGAPAAEADVDAVAALLAEDGFSAPGLPDTHGRSGR